MNAPIDVPRCGWVSSDPLYLRYHDTEWGVPSRDDRHLFEMLVLEGAQAGLSWITILRKRDRYRAVFENFDPVRVARFTERDVARLLDDPGIVRNRMKVTSAITNARAVVRMAEAGESLSEFLWSFVDGKPVVNRPASYRDGPTQTEASRRMSKALKKRGFRFVGPTICYAFMQAVGMVDDHEQGCFRAAEI